MHPMLKNPQEKDQTAFLLLAGAAVLGLGYFVFSGPKSSASSSKSAPRKGTAATAPGTPEQFSEAVKQEVATAITVARQDTKCMANQSTSGAVRLTFKALAMQPAAAELLGDAKKYDCLADYFKRIFVPSDKTSEADVTVEIPFSFVSTYGSSNRPVNLDQVKVTTLATRI